MAKPKGLGQRSSVRQVKAIETIIGKSGGAPMKKSKNVEFDMALYQRLRRAAFEMDRKEVHLIREALDEFLDKKGY